MMGRHPRSDAFTTLEKAFFSERALLAATALLGTAAFLAALAAPLRAFAQEEAESGGDAPSAGGSVVFDYLADGGPVMYVILLLSVLGTAIFAIRAVDLYLVRRLGARSFMAKVLGHVEKGALDRALAACNVKTKHPLVEVVRTGVLAANQREKDVERAIEDVMLKNIDPLSKMIGLMALLANTATLLGLLGTIFGLIAAFNSVAAASAAERQQALADGISQAMYTTAFGIAVAVPLLFFHHFLSRRQEVIMTEMESGATATLVALGKARRPADSGDAVRSPEPLRSAL